MKNILEAKGICKKFGAVQALSKVDIYLEKNEILALVGDNGAGKSTLIKILAGAIKKDEGEIYIDGVKIEPENPKHIKNLGIEVVYQDLALINHLNVYQNLFLGREIQKKFGFIRILDYVNMKIKTEEMLARLGIELENTNEWVENLSGGQKQSIAVSRAANWGNNIVILDEPTAALGVKESSKVLQIVKKLKNQGASIIIITHNMEHAFTVADRFSILRLGKVMGNVRRNETNIDEIVKMITGGVFIKNNN